MQHESGRIFLHEHPNSAGSWQELAIAKLLKLLGVHKAQLDMRQYGLQTAGPDGTIGFAKKTTSLLTNSEIMAKTLAKRCNGEHRHVQLFGGQRCSKAAVYTVEFAQAIVDACRLHKATLSISICTEP